MFAESIKYKYMCEAHDPMVGPEGEWYPPLATTSAMTEAQVL